MGNEDVMGHIDKNDVHPWSEVLAQSQIQLLNLARALITNPEVLCVHKPTQDFDQHRANMITGILRGFVDMRGLAQDPSKMKKRRPRTLVVTTEQRENIDAADIVYKVSL